MAYTPTVWVDGDTITAEKLNKLEQGVANEQVGPPGPAGADGQDGQDGAPGTPGADGQDGFSPTVTVTDITGGHRVTITDATGPHTFDVMDGQDGSGGGSAGVSSFNGRSGAVTPASGDYTAAMVGARASDWMPSAADVGARADTWMPTAADVGAATMTEVNAAIAEAIGSIETALSEV